LYYKYYAFAGICFLFLAVISTPFLGALAYRFSARAFPLMASGGPNFVTLRRIKVMIAVFLAVCLCFTALGLFLILYVINLAKTPNLGAETLNLVISTFIIAIISVLLQFLASLIWSLIKLGKFHRDPSSWASNGFILFLRSFGAVSDSAALKFLIRGSGTNLRVVLLSTPKEIMTSWDPMTLAVAGFSFRQPLRSVPVYLESTESSWQDDVRRLATLAKIVVADISHKSPGLSLEIDMLNKLGLNKKTIRFEEIIEKEDRKGNSNFLRKDVFSLKRSRIRRRLSQVFAFTFTYIGFMILLFLVSYAIDLTWGADIGWLAYKASLLLSVAPAIYCALALTPAGGFTRRSSEDLVKAIQQKILHLSSSSNGITPRY
jgi:hypothetical protein